MRAIFLGILLAGASLSAPAAEAAPARAARPSAWSLAFQPARALAAAKAAGYAVSPYRALGRGEAPFQASGRSSFGGLFKATGSSARRIGEIAFSIRLTGAATAEKRRFADSIRAFVHRLGINDPMSFDAVLDEQDADGFYGDETENVPSSLTVEKLGRGARRITYTLRPPVPAPGS